MAALRAAGVEATALRRLRRRLRLIDMNDHHVSLSLSLVQSPPVFVLVQVNRQSIRGQRELRVNHLDVANEYAAPSLDIELRFLCRRNLRRALRTAVTVAQ